VALLEAMAAGVAPIVRAIKSGIPELVLLGITGLLVANEPVKASATVVQLSRQSDLRRKFSNNAQSLIRSSYTSEKSMELWSQLFCQPMVEAKADNPV
jgi:glycosyltransferase involved in cell wall biosynthesis